MKINSLLIAITIHCHGSLSKAEPLVLIQGEHHVLTKSKSIWVENGSVAKIEEASDKDRLVALKPGQSEIKLDGKTIELQVLSLNQVRVGKLLKSAVDGSLQLHLEYKDGITIVKGKLVRQKDLQEILKSCENQTCEYRWNVEMSKELFSAFEEIMNMKLKQHSLPQMRLERGDFLVVHLSGKSTQLKELQSTLSSLGIEIETSSTALDLAPMVKIQITLAEVKRDYLIQYGVHWPSAYQAQFLPTPAGVTDAQFLQAQFWEKSGAGRVLASPNILCRSGKEAEFIAGGEFPIKIVNFRLQDIVWKKYGIVLKVSPLADYSGRMSISLETEVSSIDPSRTVDGVPGLFTNRVQTHFDLSKPRTIALSGLIKSEESKSNDGWPGLSHIPILGSLFSSHDFRENKSELIIFVRPEIVDVEKESLDVSNPNSDIHAMDRIKNESL